MPTVKQKNKQSVNQGVNINIKIGDSKKKRKVGSRKLKNAPSADTVGRGGGGVGVSTTTQNALPAYTYPFYLGNVGTNQLKLPGNTTPMINGNQQLSLTDLSRITSFLQSEREEKKSPPPPSFPALVAARSRIQPPSQRRLSSDSSSEGDDFSMSKGASDTYHKLKFKPGSASVANSPRTPYPNEGPATAPRSFKPSTLIRKPSQPVMASPPVVSTYAILPDISSLENMFNQPVEENYEPVVPAIPRESDVKKRKPFVVRAKPKP